VSQIAVQASVSSTEVNALLRTTFTLANACTARLQVQVLEPVAGARLELRYTMDAGETWALLSTTGVGPWVSIGAAGYARGALFNVAPAAKAAAAVVLGLFSAGAAGEALLGSVGLLVYVNTAEGASCVPVLEVGP
jgi:hypothetical protein